MNQEEIRIMSLPKMQERIREAMGRQQNYDLKIDGILVPLSIDPVNPERGLWGMVDWEKWFPVIQSDGRIKMSENDGVLEFVDTPTLALLKALAHQWNVEVE